MRRLTTIVALREALAGERAAGRTIALAPTLGALHDGHLANVRIAAGLADVVVVSIFVNPTQFDRADDLAAYPRTLDADEAALRGLGDQAPDYVFAPAESEMYPRPPRTTVHVGGGLTEVLEGASRPGHFDGVATVVTKLFNVVGPDVAVFGRKDFQQNRVIGRFVADLDVPVRLVLTPTVREEDGLALSSRNRRLSPADRAAATAIPRALRAAVLATREDRAGGRAADPSRIAAAAAATLAAVPAVAVDYLAVVDPDTLTSPDQAPSPTQEPPHLLVAVAAVVGDVRLIDNVEIGDEDDEARLLTATQAARTHQ